MTGTVTTVTAADDADALPVTTGEDLAVKDIPGEDIAGEDITGEGEA